MKVFTKIMSAAAGLALAAGLEACAAEAGGDDELEAVRPPAAVRAGDLESAGLYARAIDSYVEAIKTTGAADARPLAEAKEGLSRSLAALGLYSEATVWARASLADWKRAEAKGLDTDGRKRIIRLLMRLGDHEAALQRADEMTRAEDLGEDERLWGHEQALRCVLRLCDWAAAARRAEELARVAKSEGHRIWAKLKLAEARAEQRDFPGAAEAYRAVAAEATGEIRKLALQKLRATEAMEKLYDPVREITAAEGLRAGHEVRLVLTGSGRRRVQNLRLASFGQKAPPSFEEFQRRSAVILQALAKELAESRDADRPILGVTVAVPSAVLPLSTLSPEGVIVTSVDPGSPAEKMGLQRGDLIVVANGVELGRGTLARSRLTAAVRAAGPGGRLTLKARRGPTGVATVSGVLVEYSAK